MTFESTVDSNTFQMIFKWCEEHKYDTRGAVGGDVQSLHDWDQHFFDVNNFFFLKKP
jgi:hypothetical protein